MQDVKQEPVPAPGSKYRILAAELESAILSGRYAIGTKLPSERRLAETHGVTVMTVREALTLLEDKRLIRREQGRGTFVALASPTTAPAVAAGPIGLIGLNASRPVGGNAINWQLRMRRLQGVVDAAFQLGLQIQSSVDLDPGQPLSRLVAGLGRFAGLVLHEPVLPDAALLALHERGVPVVAVNCHLGLDYCSRIHVNSRLGASRAVRHLIGLGHRRIGLIVGDPARQSMRERLDGYRDALGAGDLPYDETRVVIEPGGWPQDAAEATRRLLALPEPPTAIFAASDYRALGVLEHLRQAGVAVPSGMALVGFDDITEAGTADPPLTTVSNPLYESGRLAVRLLHDQLLKGEPEVGLQTLECVLRVRRTCGASPA